MNAQQVCDEEEIKLFLRQQICEILNESLEQLTDTKDLTELYDSVTMVTLMVQIEEKYDISYEISELVVDTFGSVGFMAEGILKKLLDKTGGE